MSKRKPRAHLYVDGGGMVTGTHDVKLARKLIVDEAFATGIYDVQIRRDVAAASYQFRPHKARLETGRIVPTGNNEFYSEYSWFWRSGYELGKPGVTRAVVWLP